MSIVGPDTVDSGSTAEYKMVGLSFACNYEADAKLGEITGSLSSFGTETYTAPTVSATTTDIIKVTHWFTGKICATKKVIIHPAGCDGETISATSPTMACNTSQTLSVTDAVVGKTYTWEVTSGGGSVSPSTGTSTTYTAPATNANCTNNATIALKVGSSTCDSETIGINCVSVNTYSAYEVSTCQYVETGGLWRWTRRVYAYWCDGSVNSSCNPLWAGFWHTEAECLAPAVGNVCCPCWIGETGTHDCRGADCADTLKDGCCPSALI
jgi:hypothetical protein